MRRAVAAATGVAALGAVAFQVARGLRVLHSMDTHADYWDERSREPGDLLYVALGDSTAQGVGAPDPDDGYVGRLAADLAGDSGRSVRVVNLSVSGARVVDLVRDQLPALRRLLAQTPEPALVTVSIGANDTGRTTSAEFRVSMAEVVAALPSGARVADVPYFRGERRGRDARAFSALVRELVAERGDLVQVDLYDATVGLGLREYAHDLFHPSAAGYLRYHRAFAR